MRSWSTGRYRVVFPTVILAVTAFHQSAPDPACKLLTPADAATILGHPAALIEDKHGTVPYPHCTYKASTGAFETVGLTIFSGTASENLVSLYASQYQDTKPLAGLGDKALQESDGRLVVAVKGQVGCVMLRAGDPPADAAGSTKRMAAICGKVFTGH